MNTTNIGGIQAMVDRARAEGYDLTTYTLRRLIRSGAVPCRRCGRKYLISWDNLVCYLSCRNGGDLDATMHKDSKHNT